MNHSNEYIKCLKYLDMLNTTMPYDLDILLHSLDLLNEDECVTSILIEDDIPVGFALNNTMNITKEKSEKTKCESLATNKMNRKNELQELCHKLGLPQPTYTLTSHITNLDNSHIFTSSCAVGGYETVCGCGPTKKRSEMAAAEHMIQQLLKREEHSSDYTLEQTENDVIYFIDIENCPWASDSPYWLPCDRVYTFMSTYSHHYRQRSKYETMSKVMSIASHGSNAADIYMTYFVGQLSTEYENKCQPPTFVFISSDKFVGVLNDIVKETNIPSLVITNKGDLNTLLSQSSNFY